MATLGIPSDRKAFVCIALMEAKTYKCMVLIIYSSAGCKGRKPIASQNNILKNPQTSPKTINIIPKRKMNSNISTIKLFFRIR